MGKEKITVSEAELEIMHVLWDHGGPVNAQTINRRVSHMKWKRTTVSTLLSRLVEKGAVASEKQGNLYYYTPLISKREYRKERTRNFIQTLYSGSAKELAAALFEDHTLSDEDIRELKELFK